MLAQGVSPPARIPSGFSSPVSGGLFQEHLRWACSVRGIVTSHQGRGGEREQSCWVVG